MANLLTNIGRISLNNPFIAGASPLSESLDGLKRLEDAGASAIVLHSIFEEQVEMEDEALEHYLKQGTETYVESLSYFPSLDEYKSDLDNYLEKIRKAKESCKIPIIASLNGITAGGWLSYAKKIEEAGADGIELNLYYLPAKIEVSSQEIEENYIKIVKVLKEKIRIPLFLKVSPFFSSFPNIAKKFEEAGAEGLVLFNRFYQPDLDIENLQVKNTLELSSSFENKEAIRYISILYGKVNLSFIGTGGVLSFKDVLKFIFAGANAVQIVSLILKEGFGVIKKLQEEINNWLDNKGYEKIKDCIGALSQKKCPDPLSFERANYMKTLLYYKR